MQQQLVKKTSAITKQRRKLGQEKCEYADSQESRNETNLAGNK